MSSVRSNPVVSKSPSTTCPGCHKAMLAPAGAECSDCHRGRVHYEAMQLVDQAKALVAGAAPFDVLTREERAEQLEALGLELPPEKPPVKFPGFRNFTDEQLIGMVADPEANCFVMPGETLADHVGEAARELARRLDEPTPDEREAIEERITTVEAEWLEYDEAFAGGTR
jgi:hypothetical protein